MKSAYYETYNNIYKLIDDFYHFNDFNFIYKTDNNDNSFNLFLNVAGFKKEDIDIVIRKNNNKKDILITSKNKSLFFQKLNLVVPVKDEYDFEKMKAKIEDGVLKISIEKSKLDKENRDIKINID